MVHVTMSAALQSCGEECFSLSKMTIADIPAVRRVEQRCFPTPWPRDSFRHELTSNKMAHYVVLRRDALNNAAATPPPKPKMPDIVRRFLGDKVYSQQNVVGFAGLWLMVDEAHITTLAVDPDHQGNGLGELLLVSLLELSKNLKARLCTLEVRPSNAVAHELYLKYGFYDHGVRRHYYSDDGEDALVMWSPELNDGYFQSSVLPLRSMLEHRVKWINRMGN